MKKCNAIIVGGTGQFGITLSKQLLKKKFKVTITTRSLSKAKKKLNNKKIDLKNLNILSKTQIKKLLLKYNPKIIFYLAESLARVFLKKEGRKINSSEIILINMRNFEIS